MEQGSKVNTGDPQTLIEAIRYLEDTYEESINMVNSSAYIINLFEASDIKTVDIADAPQPIELKEMNLNLIEQIVDKTNKLRNQINQSMENLSAIRSYIDKDK